MIVMDGDPLIVPESQISVVVPETEKTCQMFVSPAEGRVRGIVIVVVPVTWILQSPVANV